MSKEQLFDSKTDPIPGVRRNIDIIPVENNGQSYLYFHDSLGYATPDFALDRQAASLLSLLDGRKSIEDLSPYLGENVSTDQLLKYIRFLDENRLLQSSHYYNYAEQIEQQYEESGTHEAVTPGSSYPKEPDELQTYLENAFSGIRSNGETLANGSAKALYAPHIDPRVGMDTYAHAFSAIRYLEPKRLVILATSHYAGLYRDVYQNYPFIVSRKNFQLPTRTITSDKKAIDKLVSENSENGLTDRDRAHRIEHSIELPLLFLSHLWKHEFSIVPVLVSSIDDLMYMREGHRAEQIAKFGESLQKQFGNDNDTFFLISGDLAHVGKKFGDKKPAREMFEEVRKFDQRFLSKGEEAKPDELLELISEKYDPYRICGFPPLYTFLKSMSGLKGKVLNYDLWDEHERESAVSFGSILYWNTDKMN
ncbi:AmmeMemoRadiSam system protein B [Balneolaceae bacterium YR4-1]|uniref:AmmeMemoRadiSam system protein B n=1 Tax=Halalkalibaculum roseum TaxID=2709311 RepID=A0A6M1T055_9BACT|nr:AmmeMemoRadiSam system protein B [Halalkalibaculum roseum]NGP77486.1 AmmeMemoRadiSam system protein B [Halalkalibaculum roseum]